MASQTMLEWLRMRSMVDCDTMDVEVAKSLGPFVDCTSNQAIAYNELVKPVHAQLIKDSVALSRELGGEYPGVGGRELAGEIAMLKLQHKILPYLTGYIHIQTNPLHSHDFEKTVKNAQRIIALSKTILPEFDTKRICIKIPSTWAGLQACKVLETQGIATLATTLFVMEQVVLAGEVGCRYIAPYVNELRVHFEAGFVDHRVAKASLLCLAAQNHYVSSSLRTQVLPASLTHIDEVLALAGVQHITISPGLLQELLVTDVGRNKVASLFEGNTYVEVAEQKGGYGDDEMRWKREFEASDGGEGARKLDDAIKIFCEMQVKLEALMA